MYRNKVGHEGGSDWLVGQSLFTAEEVLLASPLTLTWTVAGYSLAICYVGQLWMRE